ncbi:hypothetical protein ONZ51_g12375 [Trametes cubensis]|uniref:Uncharacterized protein n=1 Tax=Trametes cubensis TaxID=1111947 RepID=A0AAD7X5G8_9APHY|nr:hypothetical protein ONZ51_g12375 [Trametes cubensis]
MDLPKHIILLGLRPFKVTLFVSAGLWQRAAAEVALDFTAKENELFSKLRVAPLPEGENPLDSTTYEVFLASEPLLFRENLPMIFAVNAFKTLIGLKAILGSKVYNWMAASTSSTFVWYAEDYVSRANELSARTGIPFDVAAHQLLMKPTGRVLYSPCLPPMYDHELRPQALPTPPEFCGRILIHGPSVVRDTDGIITFDAAHYFPEATAAMRAWLATTFRKIVYAGLRVRLNDGQDLGDETISGIMRLCLEPFKPINCPTWDHDTEARRIQPCVCVWLTAAEGYPSASCAFVPSDLLPPLTTRPRLPAGVSLTRGTTPCSSASSHTFPSDQSANAIHITQPCETVAVVCQEFYAVIRGVFGPEGEEKRAWLDGLSETLASAWREDSVAQTEVETFLDAFAE